MPTPPKSPLENPLLKPSHPRHLPRPAALVGLAPAGTEDATGATAAAKAGRAAMAGRGPKGPGGTVEVTFMDKTRYNHAYKPPRTSITMDTAYV